MLKKSQSRMQGNAVLFTGLSILFLVLILAGFVGSEWLDNNAVAGWIITTWITVCSICSVLVISLIVLVRKKGIHSVEDVLKMGRTLAEKDIASFRSAVSEFSQGNMSVRMDPFSKPATGISDPNVKRFAEVLNGISASLQEAAAEFNTMTEIPCKRMCYVGSDSFLDGWRCGEVMGELLGGKGQVAITLGLLKSVNLNLRRKGFQSHLREKHPGIEVVEIYENLESPEIAYAKTLGVLKRFPHLSGIYAAEGGTPEGVARAVAECNKVQKVKIVGHDLIDSTMRCIQKGWIAATLSQDPFAQGYEPVVHLFNHLVGDWQPTVPRLLTRQDVVTQANCRQFWDDGRGVDQRLTALERLTKPMDIHSGKPLKIAVLGIENSAFWVPVREGVAKAGKTLEPFGVTVRWTVPEKTKKDNDSSAAAFGPAIQEAVRQGCDGIAVVVKDANLVPYLNEAVDAGVPVVTYNAEPFSMRSLVYTITQQADRLMGLSGNLASSAQQVSMATNQINVSMNQIAQGAVSQNNQVKQTEQVLESLLTNIDKVSREAGESASSAENTAKAVVSGTDAMDKTLGGIKSIEQSVEETWKIVEELRRHSERIDMVVELINDIASQVNVLSLNAAIEATRAGDSGKGFMVVANEIRKLARSTGEATGEVTGLVGTVQSGIQEVERSMEAGLEKVQHSANLTDIAKGALGSIRELVESNRIRMGKIASAIGEMQRFSHQVGEAMGSVTTVSEKNAQAVEEIHTATEEMNAQFKEVASLARSLENMAQSEQELLAKFIVSTG